MDLEVKEFVYEDVVVNQIKGLAQVNGDGSDFVLFINICCYKVNEVHQVMEARGPFDIAILPGVELGGDGLPHFFCYYSF